MSLNIRNEDLRGVKTKKALNAAMFRLLKKHSFRKITIRGICEEALISRAAFYAHFIDKYDLLEYSIARMLPENFYTNNYEQIEKVLNCSIHDNMLILENLTYDADKETLAVLFNYILSTMNLVMDKQVKKEFDPKNIVLSNFYAGGIIYYLFWQINNKFPSDVPPMNKYLYEIIVALREWQAK